VKKGNQQRFGQAGTNPQDQAGVLLVELVEPPRPGVLHARHPDIQQQRSVGLDGRYRPTGPRAHRNHVADLQVLELGDDLIGARAVKDTKEAINPVVGVHPTPPVSHLHQPRPDLVGPGLDRDGAGRHVRRVLQLVVVGS